MGGPKAPLSPQESVAAMRRLIETLVQINRVSSTTTTVANIRGEGNAAQFEATDLSIRHDFRVVPDSPWMRTGLYQQSNLSPRCRTGNWKKASRDGRPKHAPKDWNCRNCRSETKAGWPN
jgi:hypothetical protein